MSTLEKGPASAGIQARIIPRGTFPFGSSSAPHLICASSMHSSPASFHCPPIHPGTLLACQAPGTTVNILL